MKVENSNDSDKRNNLNKKKSTSDLKMKSSKYWLFNLTLHVFTLKNQFFAS